MGSASESYKFEGWMGLDPQSASGKMVYQEYSPKKWEETDVDIKITHTGICGSDLHTLRSGWGPTIYPCVVGHEIVGEAVRVGAEVKGIKIGDRVGVGAQSDSCLQGDCEDCLDHRENQCQKNMVGTYNGTHKTGDHSYGGYAKYWRGPSHFVIKIPDALSSEEAAPMLCGGITVFNPLSANGCGPGKKVGIVGIGGLGHFGLLFAKALGAHKVVAISRGSGKKADALKMGADDFIATAEEEDWGTKHAQSLDLIISTVSSPKMPLQQYLQLLRTNGTFIQVGAPEDPIPAFMAFALIGKGVKIGGSMIGSPDQIRHMLDLAAEKGVHSWTNPRPMSEANKAVVDFEKNPPRYRFVLVN